MSASALEPLRGRYAAWLGMDARQVLADREEDPDRVRAIQLLLQLERGRIPSWHAALAAAASGCAALCLDARAEPGEEWFEAVEAYCRGHIRKVTRRGRGAQWRAAADLPGLSVSHGDTRVRVLVPGLVSELDKRVAKLQVGGTDLPVDDAPVVVSADPGGGKGDGIGGDEPSDTGGEPDVILTVLVPEAATLTAGKLMAQAGHAGMLTACLLGVGDQAPLAAWRQAGCPARVRRVGPQRWLDLVAAVTDPEDGWRRHRMLAVRDAGFTEVAPGTITVIGALDGGAE